MASVRAHSRYSLRDILYFFGKRTIGWTRNTQGATNPVVESAEYVLKETDIVQLNNEGVKTAARYVLRKLTSESYTPRTWRTHLLHICPPDIYSPSDPLTKLSLDWIFLISSLNFSFWSEKEGNPDRYGVEWREGWGKEKRVVHTGYWSLVAALNRALEEDIPITDPTFYSCPIKCPDSLIEYIFRPAAQSSEKVPLLKERIQIMRENGSILCNLFSGSYQGFIEDFHRRHNNQGTSLALVKFVTGVFPSFRDEQNYNNRKVYFWKRPQILVAETWAAFYPADSAAPHPIFPGRAGAAIHRLTMFADYRVPQILHHLRILSYPPSLVDTLQAGTMLQPGCKEELSLRAASIVAVERVREEMLNIRGAEKVQCEVSSVLIDFYLWDLAKKLEGGEERIEGAETAGMIPAHRTRSIWY